MKKRLLAFFLCTVLVMSTTGCRKQAETGNGQNPSEEVETLAASGEKETGETIEESEAEPEEETGETTEPVKESEPLEIISLDNKEDDKKPENVTEQKEAGALEEKAAKPEKPEKTTVPAENKETVKNTSQTSGEKTPESSAASKPSTPAATQPEQKPSKPEQTHTCTWDSGKVTTAATCSNEGVKTYTCTGCGKTRTESIAKTSHNYVTEKTPATCTKGEKTVTSCSICGDVQSESYWGAPAGHVYQRHYFPSEPTCQHGADYTLVCTICGELGESGSQPALPHDIEVTEIRHGNCTQETVTVETCRNCGTELGRNGHTEPNDHDWQQVSYEELNLITGKLETKTVTACSRCHARQ